MRVFFTLALFLTFFTSNFAQDKQNQSYKLAVSLEPINYLFGGHSVWLGLRYKQYEAGVFSFSSPSTNHVLFESNDNLEITLDFGLAFYGRYYLSKRSSSPFIGMLIGDEKWGIKDKASSTENELRNSFFTPQLGYQWVIKKRFFISPNFRFILPFNDRGPEMIGNESYTLRSFGVIPAFDIGMRFSF